MLTNTLIYTCLYGVRYAMHPADHLFCEILFLHVSNSITTSFDASSPAPIFSYNVKLLISLFQVTFSVVELDELWEPSNFASTLRILEYKRLPCCGYLPATEIMTVVCSCFFQRKIIALNRKQRGSILTPVLDSPSVRVRTAGSCLCPLS